MTVWSVSLVSVVWSVILCLPCLWYSAESALSLSVWCVSLVSDGLMCQPCLWQSEVSAVSLTVWCVSLVSDSLKCQPCLWRSKMSFLSLTAWSVSLVSDTLKCQLPSSFYTGRRPSLKSSFSHQPISSQIFFLKMVIKNGFRFQRDIMNWGHLCGHLLKIAPKRAAVQKERTRTVPKRKIWNKADC